MALLFFIFLLTFVQDESTAVLSSSPIFGPKQVTGLLGGSITVKCFYPRSNVNRHSRKYWCKESTRRCSTLISTSGYVAPEFTNRASITDFPENGIFIIEISELGRRDMGQYKCGIGLNDKGLSFRVQLDVSEDSVMPDEAQLFYTEQHGSLTMTCDFGNQYASFRKYLCKMSKTSCSTVIDTHGNIDPSYKGRILLTYLDIPGSFQIIMTLLKKEDSGLYLCGAGNYGAEGESKKLDVHVYEGALVPKGQPILSGVQGGSVSVECHYDPKENVTIKYWCKWREHGCIQLIHNFGYVLDSYEGRIVMHDDPENGTYTIILNQLNEADAGYYWCMTDGQHERKSTAELKIVEGQPSLAVDNEIHAVASSPLTISCTYPCKYAHYEKYWCKWKNTGCEPLISSDQNEASLVVTCDKASRILSLKFDQVVPTDQGWYWCGVRHAGHYGETSAVYLQVQGDSSPNEELSSRINSENRDSLLNNGNEGPGAESSADGHEERKNTTVVLSVLLPLGVVFLLLVTLGVVVKLRLFKNSDLVSVASYRTNISMTDFENVRQYGAKDNVCMEEDHETQIGRMDEYITTTGSPKSKKAKRGSKEEVEMAYTTVLLKDNTIPTRSSQEQ
ncbi:polymeric immunoglobulin receptor [Rhineura floridana]|uniref:polymeric immunoglobulin receptor n=1 Tax=Rhineura floridana TaxID=261503 RepID=UPI002AC7F4EF|nr:polymeric immunoglobulin receptor [Rhineura floridana]XP_061486342.1 polymeric immunoglobulin receptor [Rhineura floridana]XP_061486343.1 polymeric immunoglobulin receptor [Rhineura floridana]